MRMGREDGEEMEMEKEEGAKKMSEGKRRVGRKGRSGDGKISRGIRGIRK